MTAYNLVSDKRRQVALDSGIAEARYLFDALLEKTGDPPGITRIAYGDGERIAFDLAAEAAQAEDRDVEAAEIPGVPSA